jgi:hypothetical protein
LERFSETYGYKPIKTVMQVDSMDADLRIGLWNGLAVYYWAELNTVKSFPYVAKSLVVLIAHLWIDFFIAPVDTIPQNPSNAYEEIKKRFFSLAWYEVYDFIQFVATELVNKDFITYCNQVLEREVSAWRFVGKKIAPITSKEEITAIEEALKATQSLRPVAIHLNSALDLMLDRKSPDYRNSIKESISAVEAICTLLAGTKKADLSEALKVMKKKGIRLHAALEQAFTKLYAYTSNADGIRHAMLEEPDLHLEDAKFMLVACAAFISYLKSKSSEIGIKV